MAFFFFQNCMFRVRCLAEEKIIILDIKKKIILSIQQCQFCVQVLRFYHFLNSLLDIKSQLLRVTFKVFITVPSFSVVKGFCYPQSYAWCDFDEAGFIGCPRYLMKIDSTEHCANSSEPQLMEPQLPLWKLHTKPSAPVK